MPLYHKENNELNLRRARARRTAQLAGIVALLFYAGFIALEIFRQ